MSAQYQYGEDVGGLWWNYSVNDHQAFTADYEGVPVELVVGNVSVNVDSGSLTRTVSLNTSLLSSSGYSGTFSTASTESYAQTSSGVALTDSSFSSSSDISDGYSDMTVDIRGENHFLTPLPWFADRSDLAELPVGYSEYQVTSADISYSLTASDETLSETDEDSEVVIHYSWTVLEQLDSMTVNTITYTDVVKLSVETNTPNAADTSAVTTSSYIWWLARGIGLIKSSGETALLGNAVELELEATNLQQ